MVPRGIRNNNPLNLRKSSSNWLGRLEVSTDRDFEQFKTLEYGIRAAFVNMRTQIKRMHSLCITTNVYKIIERWAPPSENNTATYVTAVCLHSKGELSPATLVDFFDKQTCVLLLWSMSYVENGQDLPLLLFERAYEMV